MGPAALRDRRAVESRDELRAGAPIAVGGVTLIAVERVRAAVGVARDRLMADAMKGVDAVVIVDRAGRRAVDLDGKTLDLDDLRSSVKGLDEILGGLPASPQSR